MKRILIACLCLSLCAAISSCNGEEAVTTAVPETKPAAPITIPVETTTIPETTEIITTEVITTEETTEETTVMTTEETTVATTTTEATTKATTEATTAATTTATTAEKIEYTPHQPSVLEGYTYGGDAVIEDRDGFTYVNGILIANKTYSLPKNFNPGDIAPEVKRAFNDMKAAAASEGITLKIISGFRSYSHQNNTYNRYVSRDGAAAADRYSARPGHSEHQTGLSMDLNSLEQSFGNTPAGIWLANHCAEYGFIIRYPQGKEEQTGFMYEPWHIRYLGKEVAAMVSESGLCLEEFLNITSYYAN